VQIHDEGQKVESFLDLIVGDITDPDLVDTPQFPIDQKIRKPCHTPAIRGSAERPLFFNLKAILEAKDLKSVSPHMNWAEHIVHLTCRKRRIFPADLHHYTQ
jgi:hypothetical protein